MSGQQVTGAADTPAVSQTSIKARAGLGRTLFSWFLVLSLLPLIFVGVIEYHNARDNILESRHQELSSVNLMLSRQLGDYFDDIVVNMHFRSGKALEFLGVMEQQKKAAPDLATLMNSEAYYQLVDKYAIEFIDLMRFYNYSDVIIGDAQGNIVYSVGRYTDFGQNLFTGELADTLFAKTAAEAMRRDERLYSDQEMYPPAGEEKVSFFILPLVNDREQVVGFMATQIWARDDIAFILSQSLGNSDHVAAYVVGQDKKIRFYPDNEDYGDAPLELEPVHKWLAHFDEHGHYLESHSLDAAAQADASQSHDADAAHNHGGHHSMHSLMSSLWGKTETTVLERDDSGWSEGSDPLDDLARVGSHIAVFNNKDDQRVLGLYRNLEVAGTSMVLVTEMDFDMAMAPATRFRNQLLIVIGLTSLLVLAIAGLITRRIVTPVRSITSWVNQVASGKYVDGQIIRQNNEIGALSRSFRVMTEKLRKVSADNDIRSWHQNGLAQINETVRGEQSMAELCRNIITSFCRYLNFPMGAAYVLVDGRRLQMMGSYALSMRKRMGSAFALGEGLPGQAALEARAITLMVPDDYFAIESGLGSQKPDRVLVMPVMYETQVKGVLEFALQGELQPQQQAFMDEAMEVVAVAINSTQAREQVQELLDKTTHQAQALQQQQEELRTANEELEHQTSTLKESEEELMSQSDELQRANAELEEKSESLFHQKEEIELKNREIEDSRKAIEVKAQELEQVNRYKSEFLANMSHELRTPLNSMLILARMLADNEEANLSEDQVESAQVIHKVGHDLLELINDILDLSKVEAGKMTLNLEQVSLEDLLQQLQNQFAPLAKERKLQFEIIRNTDASVAVNTDGQRVMQIVKNLLSNAFKFTEQGGVKLHISRMPAAADFASDGMRQHGALSFAVEDSGIGIPEEKQKAIFNAFQQADGSTSRKYGGTGLGLSIAREMAILLGGEMRLTSEAGKGSVFSLLIPAQLSEAAETVSEPVTLVASSARTAEPAVVNAEKTFTDDRDKANDGRPVLVVEDDPQFSRVLYRLANNHGCACVVAGTGAEARKLVESHNPQAIILDLGLPDMDGSELLKALKDHPSTRDIPIHIISGRDRDDSLFSMGAINYLTKPVSNQQLEELFGGFEASAAGKVLVIDPDAGVSGQVQALLGNRYQVIQAETAAHARQLIAQESIGTIILELNLPDESGDVLLQSLASQYGDDLPKVIIYTSEAIDCERYKSLDGLSGTMVVKGESASEERLQDEVAMFLSSVARPRQQRKPAAQPPLGDELLKGRKILLVDDDLRNTFALSKALQKYQLDIVLADNGELALEKLEQQPDVELVLMDIMMPVMDGYEAMEKIRAQERFSQLPMIALTAKAMAEDRDKCIQAGASDYLTKPVDIDNLVAMMRVWLQNGNHSSDDPGADDPSADDPSADQQG